MDTEQFRTLMHEIKQSRDKVKELKREVSAVQERTTHELAQKIMKLLNQFKKESQLNSVYIYLWGRGINHYHKEGAWKIEVTREQEKPVKKAVTLLDEGVKALERHQKHIKVADRSEFR